MNAVALKLCRWLWHRELSVWEMIVGYAWVLCAPLATVAFKLTGLSPRSIALSVTAYMLFGIPLWIRCTRSLILSRRRHP